MKNAFLTNYEKTLSSHRISFFAYLREIDAFFVVREKDRLLYESVESILKSVLL